MASPQKSFDNGWSHHRKLMTFRLTGPSGPSGPNRLDTETVGYGGIFFKPKETEDETDKHHLVQTSRMFVLSSCHPYSFP